MSNISIFNFDSNQVRVFSRDPINPLFIAHDVATALGYEKPRNAITRFCKNKTTAPKQGGGYFSVIGEPDVYRLVFGSKLKAAQRFQDWVVEEVLPSIRKNGMYAVDELLDNPDMLIQTATRLKEERELRLLAEQKIQQDAPKVEFAERHAVADGWYCLRDAAKQIGVSPIKFNKLLHAKSFIFKQGGKHWMPYSERIKQGLLDVKAGTFNNHVGEEISTQQCMITAKGVQHFTNLCKKEGLLS